MQRTGIANLPLHPGKCPKWLFPRMKSMAGVISEMIIDEHGQSEYLRRLSNPYFFQALGCVLGFDWHSSGLTTTVCGALKESVNSLDIGLRFAGGKGNASRRTMSEIDSSNLSSQQAERLKHASRMAAKVDNALVQDSYQLYHHVFVFSEKGKWAVVQQGMNTEYARRYHWLSDSMEDFVEEPHNAICCDKKQADALDMTSRHSRESRKASLDLVRDDPSHIRKYFAGGQTVLSDFGTSSNPGIFTMPSRHYIAMMGKREIETLQRAHEIDPKSYEELVGIKGIGPKMVRSLALVSELVYGEKASWSDPVRYSFAHGGKDGIPRPVDRKLMDDSTQLLRQALSESRLGQKDKVAALKRLGAVFGA